MERIPNRDEESAPQEANPLESQDFILENEPCYGAVKSLLAKSEFSRSGTESANCTIEREGERFTIEVIESEKDPAINNVCRMLKKTFGVEEVDPPKVTREAVEGYSPDWDVRYPKYRIITIKDERGRLVSVFTGAQLDVLNKNGQPTEESVYSVGYAATSPKLRQRGLAREAYTSALIDASKQARSEGKSLKFAIGECTHTSEKFWNDVGWKRIYAKTGEKKYAELKYIQPALDFDEETGKPAKDAGECAEHLMVDSFGHNPPSVEELKKLHEALLHYNGDWPDAAFESPKAHETHIKYMDGFKRKFKSFLDAHSSLIFLDAENREKAKKAGVKITEYKAADRVEAGEEDF